ncbi:hypothetical protein HII17_03565 [Thalassotalea sp. M1531]|uniref:Uncharacterized protein n=1 Tax=Thalassotalea algicola TaxID=2716224 RepID=A0A7Y0LBG4_9GAMM|nr:hypothetical protein [Thalassotalea algicola]NMP30631.1 hypothetical protein [Thalassotalea algicola]
MIVLALIVVVIFVVVSIYFYFRSERLQHELMQQKRESVQTRKDYKLLMDTLAVVAAKQSEFYLFRYNATKEKAEKIAPTIASDMALIWPIVNNYSAIFRSCSSGKEKLRPIVEKCFESYKIGSFKEFLRFISGQEKHIKRMWASDNLNGFMSMMEALLTEQQGELAKVKPIKKQPSQPQPTVEFQKFNQG